MKPEVLPVVRRLTTAEAAFLISTLIIVVMAGVFVLLATKAPCSWRPAWRSECWTAQP